MPTLQELKTRFFNERITSPRRQQNYRTFFRRLEDFIAGTSEDPRTVRLNAFYRYTDARGQLIATRPVDESFVDAFLATLRAQVTPSVYNDSVSCLRTFFGYLADNGFLPRNPARRARRMKRGPVPRTWLSEESYYRLEAAALASPFPSQNLAIVRCLFLAGLRIKELVNLLLEDLMFEEGYIRIRPELNHARNGMPAPLRPEVAETLRAYMNDAGRRQLDPFPYVFCKRDSKGSVRQFTAEDVNKILKELAKEANLPQEPDQSLRTPHYGIDSVGQRRPDKRGKAGDPAPE